VRGRPGASVVHRMVGVVGEGMTSGRLLEVPSVVRLGVEPLQSLEHDHG
jgi:hypothetical protein